MKGRIVDTLPPPFPPHPQIIAALGVAYTLFMGVLWLPFFPFLNLVSIFIVIGIGADDVFVYVDHWEQAYKLFPPTEGGPHRSHHWDDGDDLHYLGGPVDAAWVADSQRVAWVLQHGGGAMLVTSLTTR